MTHDGFHGYMPRSIYLAVYPSVRFYTFHTSSFAKVPDRILILSFCQLQNVRMMLTIVTLDDGDDDDDAGFVMLGSNVAIIFLSLYVHTVISNILCFKT